MKYLSTFEVAEKWGISPRRVSILCNNDRIPGAQRAGSISGVDGVNQGQHEFVADSRVQNPEQIFISKETLEEIHTALQMIDERDKAYLWYRFGFEDDMLHPLKKTAKHFHLSESKAKSTERLALDNVWLELPWWY